MKKIGIITYDYPHRKTMDVLSGLLLHGIKFGQITLLLQPWSERPKRHPIYSHRPEAIWNPNIFLLPLTIKSYSLESMKGLDVIILAGANILRDVTSIGIPIINAHPGWLPNMRGLDAFKWAIFLGMPIGVTLHFVNRFFDLDSLSSDKTETSLIDTGDIIERRIIPVYFEDTFHSVAQRLYEMEIKILVGAALNDHLVASSSQELCKNYPLRKRMPPWLEPVMMERFESIRKHSKSKYEI